MYRTRRGWLPHRRSKFSKEQKEEFAAKQRANPTFTERLMWEYIRDDQCGATFERQVVTPCGWIADFLCENPKIIIEIDGSKHVAEKDRDRDLAHFKKGYVTLRITADEVESRSPRTIMARVRMLAGGRGLGDYTLRMLDDMKVEQITPPIHTPPQTSPNSAVESSACFTKDETNSLGDVIASLHAISPTAAAILREGDLTQKDGEVFVLFPRRHNYHYNKCMESKYGPIIRQLLEEHLGTGVSIRLSED